MYRSRRNSGTTSPQVKNTVLTASAKNPNLSRIPIAERSSFQKTAASMAPVTISAPIRVATSSGWRRALVKDLLVRVTTSAQRGLAKSLERRRSPDTSFPLEMLALMASFRVKGVTGAARLWLAEYRWW